MTGRIRLGGSLAIPEGALGVVLVVVQSAAERSGAPIQVADYLHHFGFATLLVALEADVDTSGSVGLERMAGRIGAACAWVARHPRLGTLPVGLLGLGRTAAPTLVVSAHLADRIGAVVCAGGRADLAGPALGAVVAPTLLVAGSRAAGSLGAAREALRALPGRAELAVIEDADDPLAETASLGTVCHLARTWLAEHLAATVS